MSSKSKTNSFGRYLLSITTPEDKERDRADEIARVIHDSGFSSEGARDWLSPDDPNAPAELWNALGEIGVALEMDTAVLPPSLLLIVADMQFH